MTDLVDYERFNLLFSSSLNICHPKKFNENLKIKKTVEGCRGFLSWKIFNWVTKKNLNFWSGQ